MPRKILLTVPSGKTVSPTTFSRMYKVAKSSDAGPTATVEDYILTVEDDFAALLRQKDFTPTKDQLCRVEFTAILRIAGARNANSELMFPLVAQALHELMGFRGLPIKIAVGPNKPTILLHKHQIMGIDHIRAREEATGREDAYGLTGSIVKLEMGLGKTLLAIAWSLIAPRPACTERHGENGFPTLVVASKTVMIEWKTEGFEKFFGRDVKVLYFHKSFISPTAYKNMSRRQLVKYDFVVTTYDVVCAASKEGGDYRDVLELGEDHTLMKGKIVSVHCRERKNANNSAITGQRVLFHTPWERVIADESQRFANPSTFTYKAMMGLYGRHKLCLTGTPIKNYCTDIWAQLRWCGYTGVKRTIEWKRNGATMMDEHRLARAILSIETKDTDIVLPNKITVESHEVFEGMEKQAYEYVLGVARTVYDEMMASMVDFACMLALFTRLRQMCIAPYLITADSKRGHTDDLGKSGVLASKYLKNLHTGPMSEWVKDKNGTAGIRSRKMQLIIKALKEIPKGEKVVIFSMFTSCLDLLADAIKEFMPAGFVIEQLDGQTPDKERSSVLENFRSNKSVRALLMSYKVGSEGLNLTSGNHVICIEPWWTYAVPAQAEARCYRPGQTKEVYIHNIFIEGSIEQRIIQICEQKKEMAEMFLDGTGREAPSGGPNKFVLGQILGSV